MPPKTDQYARRRETTLEQIKAVTTYAGNIPPNADIISIQTRLDKLQQLMQKFSDTEDELFARDEVIDSKALECDDLYYTAVTKLNTRIREIQQTSSQDNIMTMNIGNTTFNQTRYDTKLPRITLPTFDGNYQEWQSFHDMFMSTVHDNPTLTSVQKLHYLKGALRGEASASLRHLVVTETNYKEAYQRLVKRYSKKKLILNSFIKTFVQQPAIINISAKHLRQLCDTSDEIIRGIKALGNGAEGLDSWLIFIVLNKLDEDTQQRWSDESANIEYPTWQAFIDFITKRADALESCQPTHKKPPPRPTNIHSHTVAIKNCPLCDTVHNLYQCPKFKEMTVDERREFMKGASRCYNCLCDSHSVSRCRSKSSCYKCQKRHNTLLHLPFNQNVFSDHTKTNDDKVSSSIGATATTSTCLAANTTQNYQLKSSTFKMGLLQTAIVNVRGANNILYSCRALLDSGSLASFITEACAQKLGLPRKNHRTIVEGLSSTKVGTSTGRVHMEVFSRSRTNTSFNIEALVLSSITSNQPQINIADYHWEEFRDLELADPKFHESRNIEILIGCDHYLSLLLPGHIDSTKTNLTAQETILGWIISGTLSDREPSKITTLCTSINIDKALTKFWEIEDIKTPTPQTQQEIKCETNFLETYQRNSEGRYIVSLPFDPEAATLGESKSQAIRRLQSVERRLARDANLKREYSEFMREYKNLGHMECIPSTEIDIPWNQSYYLPHHAVYKETSTTTKVRVVFDASAKTKTGRSLNDNLLVGPTIQQTLQQTLLRFRFHRYVMTADLEKMFRQILITRPHADFQRILWREEPIDPIEEFRLLTVTYGTAPAPFLSTRVLKQIADDNQQTFPTAASIIGRDFYVDDLMTGADTMEQLNTLKTEISSIMKASGFNLRKWLSNCPLNDEISTDHKKLIESDREEQYSKVLGMYWNTTSDLFTYRVSLNDEPTLTKRGMLSEASKLFDPQGWLAPITIYVKIIFQRTWAKGLEWDDPLPKDISDDWNNFRTELKLIESITVPRWLKITSSPITLHGFSDASQNAYAAVVYAVCNNEEGEIEVTIVSAKTKVAPVQKQITIPQLELCAALLLSNLMKTVQELFDRETNVHLWSDSTIVLSWLEKVPRSLDVFVGNRISQIITNYSRSYWQHITTKYNPADCASRGILPSELLNHNLWWTGPEWLKRPETEWPVKCQPKVICNLATYVPPIQLIVSKFSSFNKIIRVIAYCRRYVNNCKVKPAERHKAFISCAELNESKELLIKYVQENNFYTEIKTLKNNIQLPKNHKFINLNPFLDKNGILRVGGRIERATVPFDVKHPILLPNEDVVVETLVRTTHETLLHGNHTQLFTTLKQRYWILNCKTVIRRVIKKCVKCVRQAATTIQPIMADLPSSRVTFVRPFLSTGVDYAGPIYVRPSKRRGLRPDKSYIAVFICLSTKAIHLELAGDMSTDSFIAAFRRFISRRGLCREIISDNGSNFVGAKNDLNELFQTVKDIKISNFLSQNNIIWKFNPPAGSHFGGIYEAAVKSTKYHLKRTLSEALLTYEEMNTLLAQIEAILNSRPLCVNSDDDLNPLTPAHFLIGHPYTSLPDPDTSHIKLNYLSRWQFLQRLRQEFWKKWHLTYLTSLQKRTKWKTNAPSINIDHIVLIREDNTPPNKWNLGRVVDIHPGKDNIVRVVTVKTASGVLKRPVVKLVVLPIDKNSSTS